MELQFYRHKEYKNIFLKRSCYCGGNKTTQFYDATFDVLEAIRDLDSHKEDFLSWLHTFPETKTEVVLKKEMEFDGYKGTLCKKILLNISDFELVTLRELTPCTEIECGRCDIK